MFHRFARATGVEIRGSGRTPRRDAEVVADTTVEAARASTDRYREQIRRPQVGRSVKQGSWTCPQDSSSRRPACSRVLCRGMSGLRQGAHPRRTRALVGRSLTLPARRLGPCAWSSSRNCAGTGCVQVRCESKRPSCFVSGAGGTKRVQSRPGSLAANPRAPARGGEAPGDEIRVHAGAAHAVTESRIVVAAAAALADDAHDVVGTLGKVGIQPLPEQGVELVGEPDERGSARPRLLPRGLPGGCPRSRRR